MAKFIENISAAVICTETKNFIPGVPAVEVTDAEASHPMIAAYVKAGKLALTDDAKTTKPSK